MIACGMPFFSSALVYVLSRRHYGLCAACITSANCGWQVNTIRIYNLDPSLNHDECVSIFNAAGIYLLLDVSTPIYGEYLNRAEPSSSYTKDFVTRLFSMVEAFKDYPNLLGFFGGNEIINEDAAKDVPAYIRVSVYHI